MEVIPAQGVAGFLLYSASALLLIGCIEAEPNYPVSRKGTSWHVEFSSWKQQQLLSFIMLQRKAL